MDERFAGFPGIEWDPDRYRGDAYPSYSWSAVVADVEVDRDTGEVAVTTVVQAVDAGRIVNPALAAAAYYQQHKKLDPRFARYVVSGVVAATTAGSELMRRAKTPGKTRKARPMSRRATVVVTAPMPGMVVRVLVLELIPLLTALFVALRLLFRAHFVQVPLVIRVVQGLIQQLLQLEHVLGRKRHFEQRVVWSEDLR